MRKQRIFPVCAGDFAIPGPELMLRVPVDELTQLVYEGDGNDNPVTEIARLLHTTEPAIAQFINDKLLRPVDPGSSPAPTPELAEELSRRPGESLIEYGDRMREIYDEWKTVQELSTPEPDKTE